MRKFGLLLFLMSFLSATLCLAQSDCVYTAGFTRDANGRQYAAYWKSGQITKLTNGTNRDEARTIAVSGYDVHVGGFKINGVNRVAAYWKNGQQMQLNLIGNYSGGPSEVYAIKTVGSDVYMFVTQPNRLNASDPNNYYYYKNGVRQTSLLSDYQAVNHVLTKSESYFVTRNGDVYIVNPTLIEGKITYWKNGNRVAGNLNYSNLNRVDLNSIFVSDYGDVYIAGNKISNTGSTKAAYWKNGNEVVVSYDSWNTYTTGIYVDGSTVYVAGYETKTPSHFSAVYWKNGYKTVLHNYDTDTYDATATSIATVYGTVYVAGMHKNDLYWVNGKEAKLDQAAGQIYSMAVVKGGGCFNNIQSNSVTTPGYQSSSTTNQVRQQQSVNEDIKQLAVGISGLMASIKADKERRLAEVVTANDFTMNLTPFDPLTAKEQASRFVAGFAKRPGVLTTPKGVLYQELTAGTGAKPTTTDNVKINFRKTTVVGKQYITAVVNDKGETINIAEIGPALAEGIRLMSAGSKYCFVFPAQLAGKQPDYPEGSVTIVWVIDLLEVLR